MSKQEKDREGEEEGKKSQVLLSLEGHRRSLVTAIFLWRK